LNLSMNCASVVIEYLTIAKVGCHSYSFESIVLTCKGLLPGTRATTSKDYTSYCTTQQ
jgi:hypothetical protein